MEISVTLEKAFFKFILDHPSYYFRVDVANFNNKQIGFVYQVIQTYYNACKNDPHVPKPRKIVELVRMYDPENRVTDDVIKSLLTFDLSQFIQNETDDWLETQLKSWCTIHNFTSRSVQVIEKVRSLSSDTMSWGDIQKVIDEVKELVIDPTITTFNDDNLGLDFDNPEDHFQNEEFNKIKTGWDSLNEQLNGGWKRKTMTVLAGPSNVGKSQWLCNIGANCADMGYNVLYVTLEMSETDVLARVGSKRLRIPIDDYATASKDQSAMKEKILALKKRGAKGLNNLYGDKIGKFLVREFATGSARISDIDQYIKGLQDKKGIKIDVILVDYLTIMCPNKADENLYIKGKQLSEGLRAMAKKYEAAVITAVQVGKEAWNTNDMDLADVSESKAIVETCDLLYGIIQNGKMKRDKKYQLKLLKIRAGAFKWERTSFDFDSVYLDIINDVKILEQK
jgi:replicative DNA helicase